MARMHFMFAIPIENYHYNVDTIWSESVFFHFEISKISANLLASCIHILRLSLQYSRICGNKQFCCHCNQKKKTAKGNEIFTFVVVVARSLSEIYITQNFKSSGSNEQLHVTNFFVFIHSKFQWFSLCHFQVNNF